MAKMHLNETVFGLVQDLTIIGVKLKYDSKDID
jgi:hypothetical protein